MMTIALSSLNFYRYARTTVLDWPYTKKMEPIALPYSALAGSSLRGFTWNRREAPGSSIQSNATLATSASSAAWIQRRAMTVLMEI